MIGLVLKLAVLFSFQFVFAEDSDPSEKSPSCSTAHSGHSNVVSFQEQGQAFRNMRSLVHPGEARVAPSFYRNLNTSGEDSTASKVVSIFSRKPTTTSQLSEVIYPSPKDKTKTPAKEQTSIERSQSPSTLTEEFLLRQVQTGVYRYVKPDLNPSFNLTAYDLSRLIRSLNKVILQHSQFVLSEVLGPFPFTETANFSLETQKSDDLNKWVLLHLFERSNMMSDPTLLTRLDSFDLEPEPNAQRVFGTNIGRALEMMIEELGVQADSSITGNGPPFEMPSRTAQVQTHYRLASSTLIEFLRNQTAETARAFSFEIPQPNEAPLKALVFVIAFGNEFIIYTFAVNP